MGVSLIIRSERIENGNGTPFHLSRHYSRQAWGLLTLHSGNRDRDHTLSSRPQLPAHCNPTQVKHRGGGGAHSPVHPCGVRTATPAAPRPPCRAGPRVSATATDMGHPCAGPVPDDPRAATASARPGGYLGLSRRMSVADAAILEAPSPGRNLSAAPSPTNGGCGGREAGRAQPRSRLGLPGSCGPGGARAVGVVHAGSLTCSELRLYAY